MARPRYRLTPVLALFALSLSACSGEDPDSGGAMSQAEAADDAPAMETTVTTVEPLPEVIVLYGQDLIGWLESENWWGEEAHETQLSAPHILITGINPEWRDNSQKLPVQQKKEIFYRLMLPLVLHANEMVAARRATLQSARDELAADGAVSDANLEVLRRLVLLLPGFDLEKAQSLAPDSPDLPALIDDLLYRVDVVPPGLALGQAAYESGYGTSRFAVEGNALFGQWTYGGEGIKPQQQRKSKGDHRIKAFDWPFDSVRGYFINLMSHRAYEDFRALRAKLRSEGKPMDSLVLADGLVSYSERGQDYVDSLKGMIRHNKLDSADDAVFRDEPMRFLVIEPTEDGAQRMEDEIKRLRQTGELAEIIARMNLD